MCIAKNRSFFSVYLYGFEIEPFWQWMGTVQSERQHSESWRAFGEMSGLTGGGGVGGAVVSASASGRRARRSRAEAVRAAVLSYLERRNYTVNITSTPSFRSPFVIYKELPLK